MNKRFTVGSLIPGQETVWVPERNKETKQLSKQPASAPLPAKAQAAAVAIQQGTVSCTVPVVPGVVLLDAALSKGCAIQYKCRKGTCGQCAVDIVSGSGHLSSRNEAELKKLGSSPKRLACQAIMQK